MNKVNAIVPLLVRGFDYIVFSLNNINSQGIFSNEFMAMHANLYGNSNEFNNHYFTILRNLYETYQSLSM